MLRVASNHGDECKQDKDQDDLASTKPKLGLSVCTHGEEIDQSVVYNYLISTDSKPTN